MPKMEPDPMILEPSEVEKFECLMKEASCLTEGLIYRFLASTNASRIFFSFSIFTELF